MRLHRRAGRRPALSVLFVSATFGLGLTAAVSTTTAAHASTANVRPNKVGELDCNGVSRAQKPAKPSLQCVDPRGSDGGRFEDNGHYIGHDEPSVRFLSSQPGSGNDTTMTERLPVEPPQLPTANHPGSDTTHTFELTIAPWISTDVCDPNSTPMLPCTPESDANAPSASSPGAGAGFVELQFYAPGFAPFADNISCDNTHWCSALNIDSLECDVNGNCNPNCTEPVNFAFVQTNGVPPGPPSPQESDLASFTPNGHTLLMNPGDVITIHMFNAAIPGGHALEVTETDHTTGQTGFMIASAANGFMNTDPTTCAGTPFNFQPEYNTARAQNIIPWGIGPYMINDQFEIGHFEPCQAVVSKAIFTEGNFSDTYYQYCRGPYDTASEDPNLEAEDAPCYKFGDTHGGTAAPNLVTGCDVTFGAIGDLDYDGTPYYADWPDSTVPDRFPSTFLQLQPRSNGHRYPQIQFMTDASATEFNTNCDLNSGSGCVLPPKGPGNFYPYFTQAKVGGVCFWEFGNMRNGNTFDGDAQYGSVGTGTLGAFAGPIRSNPNC